MSSPAAPISWPQWPTSLALTPAPATVNIPPTRFNVPTVNVAPSSIAPTSSCCFDSSVVYRRQCNFSADFRLEGLLYNNTGIFPYSQTHYQPPYHSGSFYSFATPIPLKLHSVWASKGFKAIVQEQIPSRPSVQHLRNSFYTKGSNGKPQLLHAFAVPDSLTGTTNDNTLTNIYQSSSFEAAIVLPAGLIHVCMEQYRSSNLFGKGNAYDAALIGAENPFIVLELSSF